MTKYDYTEQYLIGIQEIDTEITYYMIIPNNKDLAILMGNLNTIDYLVINITPLINFVDFDEFLSKIRKNNKPNDMNYGNK